MLTDLVIKVVVAILMAGLMVWLRSAPNVTQTYRDIGHDPDVWKDSDW